VTSIRLRALALAVLALTVARPAVAAYHISVIDQVGTSIGGDTDQQFVEIRQLFASQSSVSDTVLGAFDATGAYVGDLLIIGSNLNAMNSHSGSHWIMATQKLQDMQGFQADFTIPTGKHLPVDSGMVCWGSPPSGFFPTPSGSWNHMDPTQYVDCVAYGAYTGSNSPSGSPVPFSPADHSIARMSQTDKDKDGEFGCSSPIVLTNNQSPPGMVSITAAVCPAAPTTTTSTTLPPTVSGGGSPKTDCYGEWGVTGATGTKPTVKCKHGAATCDDGGAGTSGCSVPMRLCFDDAAAPQYKGKCTASPVTAFALNGKQKNATDQQNAQNILNAVGGLAGTIAGNKVTFASPITTKQCSGPFDLVVPLVKKGAKTKPGSRTFKTAITAGKVDKDTLKIICTP